MVRKMPLEYIVLFEELLEITKKITFNTVSQEIKQQLADITSSIIDDITNVLNCGSKNGYNMTQGRKLIILSKFQVHQEQLNRIIEKFGFRKTCSKCGKELPATTRFYYRDCTAKDGLRNDCKQCHKATKKESYNQKRKCSKHNTPIEEEDIISEEYENIIQE
ncbi:hypothetical protein ES705_16077 [subsurface metagenome]